MLQQLLALIPVTECHIDGYYPLGTDHCVMVVKDEHDRMLITHEAASENGDDAKQSLQRLKDRGLNVTAAFSDYSQSFTEAIKAVFPHARFQADHFHTVKNIWGHLKKALLSYRRQIKAKAHGSLIFVRVLRIYNVLYFLRLYSFHTFCMVWEVPYATR